MAIPRYDPWGGRNPETWGEFFQPVSDWLSRFGGIYSNEPWRTSPGIGLTYQGAYGTPFALNPSTPYNLPRDFNQPTSPALPQRTGLADVQTQRTLPQYYSPEPAAANAPQQNRMINYSPVGAQYAPGVFEPARPAVGSPQYEPTDRASALIDLFQSGLEPTGTSGYSNEATFIASPEQATEGYPIPLDTGGYVNSVTGDPVDANNNPVRPGSTPTVSPYQNAAEMQEQLENIEDVGVPYGPWDISIMEDMPEGGMNYNFIRGLETKLKDLHWQAVNDYYRTGNPEDWAKAARYTGNVLRMADATVYRDGMGNVRFITSPQRSNKNAPQIPGTYRYQSKSQAAGETSFLRGIGGMGLPGNYGGGKEIPFEKKVVSPGKRGGGGGGGDEGRAGSGNIKWSMNMGLYKGF